MSLADLVDLVLPVTCGGCGAPGSPWCPSCAAGPWRPRRVTLPGAPPIVAAGAYTGPLRSALIAYKERGRRDLLAPLAGLLAGAVAVAEQERSRVCLVPVPSRPAAARARGGDHVLRLARALADGRWSLTVDPVLRMRRGVRDSVGLDPAAREANLRGRVRVRGVGPPAAWPVLLLDDVVTTGATLRAAAGALRAVGVRVRGALVLCDATGTVRG